jgi:predicted metal-dependent phosphoesterase TrpH
MTGMCDLHTHSTSSDGSLTPTQLIRAAQSIGLDAIALCDHNTVTGLPEFLKAAEDSSVEAIPGCEFSSDYMDIDLHIIGLFIPTDRFADITSLLKETQERKERSNLDLVANLAKDGYVIDYPALRAQAGDGFINRANIAQALVEKGYVPTVKDAFSQLLSAKGKYYTPPKRLDSFEVIEFIKSIGAVAVLAHPFLNLKEEGQLRAFLDEAVKHGLDAMETLYTAYSDETTALARRIAAEYSLKESGGSDFHGNAKPATALGIGKGNLKVPTEFLRKLQA